MPPALEDPLASRLLRLRQQLPAQTRLLAVSKGQSAAAIRHLVGLGQRSFGESRLQEAIGKQRELADLAPLDWHFIGRLQANKARGIVRHFGTIHSVASVELAQRLDRIAGEEGCAPRLLLQVKLRPDPAKVGFSAEELRAAWPLLRDLASVRPIGLMTILPQGLDVAERALVFRECADLAAGLGLDELSMGMSGDWPEAVAAGSTWLRLGTALFGDRGGPIGGEGLGTAGATVPN